ncbi:PepSY domain-containing protein [Arenimonas fontis]|jgi:uncharacterized membrane protein YkoI|uniref:PepSY domain-containing protein n=1 Tax=Arenimonas fontis TaxID=2608255 RepID=A0A5B2ZAX5_9GAMM|nr:PepSY domain-containing protein [Arenimonas fontis]KAA2284703.1 hypothetical protein F0415_08365 [Arenimonas fontis]
MRSPTLAALALAILLAGTAGAAETGFGPEQATQALKTAGYGEIRELEYEDGLWEAEVRRADGRWDDVAVDPATGEVFDRLSQRPLIGVDEVVAAVERAGYRRVHDLDRDGALWEAEAYDADGRRFELRISGYDGRILSAQPDND